MTVFFQAGPPKVPVSCQEVPVPDKCRPANPCAGETSDRLDLAADPLNPGRPAP